MHFNIHARCLMVIIGDCDSKSLQIISTFLNITADPSTAVDLTVTILSRISKLIFKLCFLFFTLWSASIATSKIWKSIFPCLWLTNRKMILSQCREYFIYFVFKYDLFVLVQFIYMIKVKSFAQFLAIAVPTLSCLFLYSFYANLLR